MANNHHNGGGNHHNGGGNHNNNSNHGGGGGGNGGGGNHNNAGGTLSINHAAGGNNHNGGVNAGHHGGGAGGVSTAQPVGGHHGVGGGTNGGATAPVATSSWTNNYQQWIHEHPHPGHSPGTPKNANYAAWLKQHPHPGNNVPSGGNQGGGANNGTGGVSAPSGNHSSIGQATAVNPGKHHSGNNNSGSSGLVTNPTPQLPGGFPTAPTDGSNDPGAATAAANADKPIGSQLGGGNSNSSNSAVSNADIPQGGATYGPGGVGAPGNTSQASVNVNSPGAGYTVRRGDSLASIAAQHGMSLKQIEALNPQIDHPNLIYPGQTVRVGDPNGGTAAPSTGGTLSTSSPANAQTAAVSDVSKHGFRRGGNIGSGNNEGGIALGDNSGFPTTSTYPPTDGSSKSAVGKLKSLGSKLKGWGSGGNNAVDPAQQAVYVASNKDTNPLHIKDQGSGSHTA